MSSAAVEIADPASRLRILPVPVTDPPPIDPRRRRRPIRAVDQGVLDLAPAALAPVPEPDPAPEPRPAADLPDPTRTVATLAPAVMEVLGGLRPASQLIRWTSQDVQTALAQRAALAARMGQQARPGRPPVVRAVQVCRPSEKIAEASVVVVEADRIRAVAIRLEADKRRWRATALEVG